MKLRDFLLHTQNNNYIIVRERMKDVLIGRPNELLSPRYEDRLNQTFGLVTGTRTVTIAHENLKQTAICVSILANPKGGAIR